MTAAAARARHYGRGIGVGLLITLASILVIVTVLAIWLNTVAFDTGTWRSTSRSMIQNTAVQKQVAIYLVDQVYSNPTVQQELNNSIPKPFQAFSPAIDNGLQQVTQAAAIRLLATTRSRTPGSTRRRWHTPRSSS